MKKRVLLAEDDDDLRNVLSQYMEVFDFTVTSVRDGVEALETFNKSKFELCVLDVMMPRLDGFTLAEQMIEIDPDVPFIFLTARTLKEDKIKGLKLGADDYIEKPFEADELVLRMSNIIKRNSKTESSLAIEDSETIPIGNYTLHPKRLILSLDGKEQKLTKKEVELISFLVSHQNVVLKREEILNAVWSSSDFFTGRSMDVFISRLRKYFRDDPKITLESIRGVGLEFRVS
ncbi:response regulator transcription factor [Ekhidna sp.]